MGMPFIGVYAKIEFYKSEIKNLGITSQTSVNHSFVKIRIGFASETDYNLFTLTRTPKQLKELYIYMLGDEE